jgi:hypothetical protein
MFTYLSNKNNQDKNENQINLFKKFTYAFVFIVLISIPIVSSIKLFSIIYLNCNLSKVNGYYWLPL